MASSAKRRLMLDLQKLQENLPETICASPIDDDIFNWQAVILGPENTEWQGGIFSLSLTFLNDYPNKPPKVKFLTKIFHPNVYQDGSICLDILQTEWSPVFDVSGLLISIQSLLNDPNPKSPANNEAAMLFVENRSEYIRRVKLAVSESIVTAEASLNTTEQI
ncbi:ubiquitin-conjugating enzyme E2, putative [Theileria equi strain WA]|uniref:Ubiquitin-conjugating enzyme E2, putative n=1 Tax=Theileria equi strain WA TaxID=1537102 RepID=L1LCD7_THEEQ|nr:ubiquitin-conjugating enzyme E2, putative [Theileria equi strain WA]EKX72915.1 ubiquitin-conjugating enzyme E2, putative [Theileria equi strain WA]|eukprot:XP_004832367.1 ubiquitin-conjugating enzyme E2, putative [Theileria equi strain WA]